MFVHDQGFVVAVCVVLAHSRDGGDMIEDRHCSACGDWMGEDEAICPHCGHDRYGVDPDDWQEAVG